MNQHGIKYMNLFDFINSKAKDGQLGDDTDSVSEKEFRDCLMTLENDGIVSLIGHKMAPTIRFCNTD